MRKLLFYLPILYVYITRLHTPLKCLSWVCAYFIPIICLLFLQNNEWNLSIRNILFALLSIVTVVNFYDIGYIQNDTETIKKENKPTSRLSILQLEHYERYKLFIYFYRIVLGLLLIYVLWRWKGTTQGCIYFLLAMIMLLVVYQLYNRMRCHWNMVFYFILSSLKYVSPLLLFPENLTLGLLVLGIMVYPVEKTTEFRSTKPADITTNIFFRKYIIKFDKTRITSYRVIAYAVLSVMAYLLFQIEFFKKEYVYLILYMFFFRFALWLLIKIGFRFKEYLNN